MKDNKKKQFKPQNESLKIAFVYCVVSVIWILSSDFILIKLLSSDNFAVLEVQAIKGSIFVIATSVMIYFLTYNSLRKIQILDKTIKNKVEMLNIKKEVLKETRVDFIKQKFLIDNVISNTFIIILSIDLDGTITSANDYFYNLTQFKESDVVGRKANTFFDSSMGTSFCKGLDNMNLEEPMNNMEVLLKCNSNETKYILISLSPIKDSLCNMKEIILIGMDITKNKVLEETIDYLGSYDTITGLPNKYNLEKRFSLLKDSFQKEDNNIALLYIDIDSFNQVSEIFGHYAGDTLLVSIGEIIQGEIGDKNLISRISNDSFAVIVTGLQCKDEINHRVDKLQELIRRPWKFQGEEFFISTTIGVAIMQDYGEEFTNLLKKASIAMEYCKRNNKGGYHHYSENIQKQVLDDVSILSDVRKALINKEFYLHYQIVYDLQSEKLYGLEALIRWKHPEKGYISPMYFIPVAETTNLIYEITNFVLDEALMQKRKWNDNGIYIPKIGINISARSFDSYDLVDILEERLKMFGVNGDEIVLEITESGFIEHLDNVHNNVDKLIRLGIKVSLDDFGTGYSSLSRLKDLHINYIKLDRTFVMNIDKDKDLKAMVASVINLSKSMGVKVVAEGIETQSQLLLLKELGCDLGQGYYIHKPMPASELEALIRQE